MKNNEARILGLLAEKVLNGQQLIVYRAKVINKPAHEIARQIDRSEETVRLIANAATQNILNYLDKVDRLEKVEAKLELQETKYAVLNETLKGFDIEPKRVLNERLSDFTFSVRCTNVLSNMFPDGKVLDLARSFSKRGKKYFLSQRNCGVGTIKEIEIFLDKHGIRQQLWG